MVLYRTLKRTIEIGKKNNSLDVEDMVKKLDVFWAVNKITKENYDELINLVLEI